jgi:hypothetical protein
MAEFKRRNFGRNHAYYLDDVKLPGVTTILGDGLAKPALVNWAARTVAGYAVDNWDDLSGRKLGERLKILEGAHYADRDAAGKRGTEVHRLGEKLIKGEKVTVPDELAGHVESYVKFLDDFDVDPVLIEAPVVSYKWKYAGTMDLGARLRGLGLLGLDIKTARSGVFPDNALQLAGYMFCDQYLDVAAGEMRDMPKWDGAAVVHVRADGYSLVPVTVDQDVYNYFLYVKAMWKWANERSKTIVGEAVTPGASVFPLDEEVPF